MPIHVKLDMQPPTQESCSVRLPKIKLWMVAIGGQCPNPAVASILVTFPIPGVESDTRVNLCEGCMKKALSLYQRWISAQNAKKNEEVG